MFCGSRKTGDEDRLEAGLAFPEGEGLLLCGFL